jgi:uncharacterized protein (DUF1499 family)
MPLRVIAAALLVLAGAAAGLGLHGATSAGETVFSGKRPSYLGVTDGRLPRCKSTPNCVSSQADPSDAVHYVAPIPFRGGALEAMAAVRKAIEAEARARVVRHEANYLYAEFRSRLMGFVDDVEFSFDEKAGVIHVRSASRLGRRDFGVNRERVERLRAALSRGLKA